MRLPDGVRFLSWFCCGLLGAALWYVALVGSVAAKLLTLLLLGAGMILSLAWLARTEPPEDLGSVSPGWRPADQAERMRLVRGGRR